MSRLLFLERYLMENTDEDTGVSTKDILDAYREHSFSGNRNTLPADIAKLREAGVEVVSSKEGNTNYYHIAKRPFSAAELRTLIDAVSSSQFITKEKSDELIRKLASLAIAGKRDSLTAKAFTADRIKTDSPEIFASIDRIGTAIEQGKKISFQYINYRPDKTMYLRRDGGVYKVSPIAMVWDDERYYVRCIDPEKSNPVNYRIDRMRSVRMLDEAAEKDPDFNPSEYANKVHNMFDDGKEPEDVILLADNDRMLNIIDRFGDKVETGIADEGHFRVTVNTVPSGTFFSWIFRFRDQIRIEGPAHVKKDYEEMLKTALRRQEES